MIDINDRPIALRAAALPLLFTAFRILLFWMLAAAMVVMAKAWIEPRSAPAGAVAMIGAVLLAAFGYTRSWPGNNEASHALAAGITWLLLAVAIEVAVSARLGHRWFALLGSAERPLLRNALLLIWIFAPAMFARREEQR